MAPILNSRLRATSLLKLQEKNNSILFTKPIYSALSVHDEKLLSSGMPHYHQEEDDSIDPAEGIEENCVTPVRVTPVQATLKHQAASQYSIILIVFSTVKFLGRCVFFIAETAVL